MLRVLTTRAGVLLRNLKWACLLGQHRWQGWFQLKICLRCQQVGFRPRVGK